MKLNKTTSAEKARKGYSDTACALLDSLILYRAELGGAGQKLERLLRMQGVIASTDMPYQLNQLH